MYSQDFNFLKHIIFSKIKLCYQIRSKGKGDKYPITGILSLKLQKCILLFKVKNRFCVFYDYILAFRFFHCIGFFNITYFTILRNCFNNHGNLTYIIIIIKF